MKRFQCPVCKTNLTKQKYEKALGILHNREAHQRAEIQLKFDRIKVQLQEAQKQKKDAHAAGIATERQRTDRLLRGKNAELARLKERLKNVTKGTTPQTDGLEFEEKLLKCLKKNFPDDHFDHVGKGGDIVHKVRVQKEVIGSIVYECKRTTGISNDHIKQAYSAKRARECDFAVLNTTGRKRGFAGLSIIDGVVVVSPLSVIAVATMLRQNLLAMHKATITSSERAKVAVRLLEYMNSPGCKNLIQDLVYRSISMQKLLKKEVEEHLRHWQIRWENYQHIELSSLHIQENIQLIQAKKEPRVRFVAPLEAFTVPLSKPLPGIK